MLARAARPACAAPARLPSVRAPAASAPRRHFASQPAPQRRHDSAIARAAPEHKRGDGHFRLPHFAARNGSERLVEAAPAAWMGFVPMCVIALSSGVLCLVWLWCGVLLYVFV